ncbi:hypothetical protein EYF80_063143 [Liparis tanakae]|uniref:Uncharacterized protein n=1 Tax=Liparis tanakae TaxID=230148 RepID=A0A4Z2ECZ9_9TELE|nr:hypothetical protein EYF80_063143 [Liparis tanakae]
MLNDATFMVAAEKKNTRDRRDGREEKRREEKRREGKGREEKGRREEKRREEKRREEKRRREGKRREEKRREEKRREEEKRGHIISFFSCTSGVCRVINKPRESSRRRAEQEVPRRRSRKCPGGGAGSAPEAQQEVLWRRSRKYCGGGSEYFT